MDFKLRTNAKHFTDEELLNDLKRVASELGQTTVGQKDYDSKGNFSHKNFYKRFGSWNDALTMSGLNISVSKTITNQQLFENLENIWKKLGRQPFYEEMRKPDSLYAVDTYCRRFGSWFSACEEFVKSKHADPEFEKILKPERTTNSRSISEKTRLRVLKRDNYKCCKCGRSPATHVGIYLHIDHIKPFSLGGTNNMENLQTLCQKCNLGKNNDESV